MTRTLLGELRQLADHTPVGTKEGIALNERILELAPDDTVAAVRLGRGLQEVGRDDAALALFERTLELDPSNVVATRRADALRKRASRCTPATPVVTNRDAGASASRVIRHARKQWPCQGKAGAHSLECRRRIAPGDRYIEIMWGEVSFFDSHRVSLACARDLWRCDIT